MSAEEAVNAARALANALRIGKTDEEYIKFLIISSSTECRCTFYLPPCSSFCYTRTGCTSQFAKGREAQVEAWFRDWASAAGVKQNHAAPHGRFDFYPVWAPPPPLPNQGLSSWLFFLPAVPVAATWSPGTNMGGGLSRLDAMRGAPGSLMLRFPRGQEQAVISARERVPRRRDGPHVRAVSRGAGGPKTVPRGGAGERQGTASSARWAWSARTRLRGRVA